jgi:hypothetical protein
MLLAPKALADAENNHLWLCAQIDFANSSHLNACAGPTRHHALALLLVISRLCAQEVGKCLRKP